MVQPAGQINILLLGADARPGQKLFRTDTIILATINPQLGTVNLLSFPRDLYINIPGKGQDRINTPYEYGGWPLLAKTFAYNFGITPDHYVVINFSNFKQLVDSLGGLDINVESPLTDYRYPHGYVTIPKGRVKMDADTILWYVRSRKTTNDLARNHRQQEVLQAIGEKLLSMNAVRRAPEFYSFYKDNVTTDLSFTDMIPFIPLAAGLADGSKLRHYYVGAGNVKNWITPGGRNGAVAEYGGDSQCIEKIPQCTMRVFTAPGACRCGRLPLRVAAKMMKHLHPNDTKITNLEKGLGYQRR